MGVQYSKLASKDHLSRLMNKAGQTNPPSAIGQAVTYVFVRMGNSVLVEHGGAAVWRHAVSS